MTSGTKKMLVLGGAAVALITLARKIPGWAWATLGVGAAAVMFVPKLRRKILPS